MNPLPEIKTGINERLKEVSPNLDLSEAPPINQKRLVTFVNHFLINIVDFLNKFSKHCTYKLLTFDQKINKIEAELCLLESKLNSIPEVADKKDVNVDLPKPEEFDSPPQNIEEKVPEAINEMPSESSENKTIEPDTEKKQDPENPELIKYRKMVQVGVPVDAVKIKMQIEGLDPTLLDS